MKVLSKYPSSEIKCVIIPDGTKSIFKRKFEELIEVLVQQFTPEVVVICELPPSLDNVEANKNLDLYKEYNNCTYGSKSGYQVLKVQALIKSNNNWSFLFWDNIHLNDERPKNIQNSTIRSEKNSVITIHPYQWSRINFKNLAMPHLILCRATIAKTT